MNPFLQAALFLKSVAVVLVALGRAGVVEAASAPAAWGVWDWVATVQLTLLSVFLLFFFLRVLQVARFPKVETSKVEVGSGNF